MAKSKPNQREISSYRGGTSPGAPPPNTIDEEQKVFIPTDGQSEITARPEKAIKTANDAAFQPWQPDMTPVPQHFATGDVNLTTPGHDFEIVGDMVAGMPRAGEAFRDTPVDLGADMATGGEPAGPKSANESGVQDYYRTLKDFPNTQRGGTTPVQKGGQGGT